MKAKEMITNQNTKRKERKEIIINKMQETRNETMK